LAITPIGVAVRVIPVVWGQVRTGKYWLTSPSQKGLSLTSGQCHIGNQIKSEIRNIRDGLGSFFCCSGRVGFNFFPLGQKKSYWVRSKNTRIKDRLASYLLQEKSMFGSCRVRAHLKGKYSEIGIFLKFWMMLLGKHVKCQSKYIPNKLSCLWSLFVESITATPTTLSPWILVWRDS